MAINPYGGIGGTLGSFPPGAVGGGAQIGSTLGSFPPGYTGAAVLGAPIGSTLLFPTPPKPARPLKISPFEKALHEATKKAFTVGKSTLYRKVDADVLIQTVGKLRPIYNGKPQRWLHSILNCGPSDNPALTKTGRRILHHCYQAGLVYMVPCIPMRAKTKFRLTQSGVQLIDHWADKYPQFKPFVDAYLPKKARKQIAVDCVDFALGMEPARILAIRGKFEAAAIKADIVKLKKERAQAEFDLQVQKYYAAMQAVNLSTQSANLSTTQTDYLTSIQAAASNVVDVNWWK